MSASNVDKRIAARKLGLLGTREASELDAGLAGDPDARRVSDEMDATLDALHQWRRRVSTHTVRVPPRVRRSVSPWPIAIAASVLLALGLTAHMLATRNERSALQAELAWVTHVVEPAREVTVAYVPQRSAPPPSMSVAAGDRDRILAQVGLQFEIPATLQGGLCFSHGRAADGDRVQLVYTNAAQSLRVFLAASKGPDTDIRRVHVGPHKLIAARREGVLAAVVAEGERADWDAIVAALLGGDGA